MTIDPVIETPDGDSLRVLAIGAHPDDIDYGAAGTMAKWASEGATITYLVVTSGDAGSFADLDSGDIPAVRRREQIAAGAAAGVQDVRFLERYRDGEVSVTLDLVKDITRVIRQTKPHIVVTMSPERNWAFIGQGHPDHLAVGEAAVRAVYPASRNPYAFPELLMEEHLQEWIVSEIWLMTHPDADTAVEVGEFVEQKVRAIAAHASQQHSPATIRESLVDRLSANAGSFGLADGAHVEVFLRVQAGERRQLRIIDVA